jgi:glutathione synthase
MSLTKKILFIADPWETLDHPRDSTIYLAQTAIRDYGCECFWTVPDQVFSDNGILKSRLLGDITLHTDPQMALHENAETVELNHFHSIHWRADPPVKLATVRLWSLIASHELNIPIINHPKALLLWNEKFSPLRFGDWAIPGIIAESGQLLQSFESFFKKNTGKRIILKPAGDAASRGVRLLPNNRDEANAVFNEMRKNYGPWFIVQEFDESILTYGETRAFLIHGKIAGALNKLPKPEAPINDLDTAPEKRPMVRITDLTNIQTERAVTIAKRLKQDGIVIATVDFIGDRILEINVTSPGLIKWIDNQRANNSLAKMYWEGLM